MQGRPWIFRRRDGCIGRVSRHIECDGGRGRKGGGEGRQVCEVTQPMHFAGDKLGIISSGSCLNSREISVLWLYACERESTSLVTKRRRSRQQVKDGQ